jgi:hypothetical protein
MRFFFVADEVHLRGKFVAVNGIGTTYVAATL